MSERSLYSVVTCMRWQQIHVFLVCSILNGWRPLCLFICLFRSGAESTQLTNSDDTLYTSSSYFVFSCGLFLVSLSSIRDSHATGLLIVEIAFYYKTTTRPSHRIYFRALDFLKENTRKGEKKVFSCAKRTSCALF